MRGSAPVTASERSKGRRSVSGTAPTTRNRDRRDDHAAAKTTTLASTTLPARRGLCVVSRHPCDRRRQGRAVHLHRGVLHRPPPDRVRGQLQLVAGGQGPWAVPAGDSRRRMVRDPHSHRLVADQRRRQLRQQPDRRVPRRLGHQWLPWPRQRDRDHVPDQGPAVPLPQDRRQRAADRIDPGAALGRQQRRTVDQPRLLVEPPSAAGQGPLQDLPPRALSRLLGPDRAAQQDHHPDARRRQGAARRHGPSTSGWRATPPRRRPKPSWRAPRSEETNATSTASRHWEPRAFSRTATS